MKHTYIKYHFLSIAPLRTLKHSQSFTNVMPTFNDFPSTRPEGWEEKKEKREALKVFNRQRDVRAVDSALTQCAEAY